MTSTQYIEIDSSYRNRSEYPSVGEFTISFEGPGSRTENNVLAMKEPVSRQSNVLANDPMDPWNLHATNLFSDTVSDTSVSKNLGQVVNSSLTRMRETAATKVRVTAVSSDRRTVTIQGIMDSSPPASTLEPDENWLNQQIGAYNGAVISEQSPYEPFPGFPYTGRQSQNRARIASYTYIGNNSAKLVLYTALRTPYPACSVSLTAPGTGYPSGVFPTSGGTGSGLTIYAQVNAPPGPIDEVYIVSCGTGYTSGDILQVVGGTNDARVQVTIGANDFYIFAMNKPGIFKPGYAVIANPPPTTTTFTVSGPTTPEAAHLAADSPPGTVIRENVPVRGGSSNYPGAPAAIAGYIVIPPGTTATVEETVVGSPFANNSLYRFTLENGVSLQAPLTVGDLVCWGTSVAQTGEVFVPFGTDASDGYKGLFLSNDTRNEYRIINRYDDVQHLAMAGGDSIANWQQWDSMSIRRSPCTAMVLLGLDSNEISADGYVVAQVRLLSAGTGYTTGVKETTLLSGSSTGKDLQIDIAAVGANGEITALNPVPFGGQGYYIGDVVSINDGNNGTAIVTQLSPIATNGNYVYPIPDVDFEYRNNPSKNMFFVKEGRQTPDATLPDLLGGNQAAIIQVGDFIEPLFGNAMYNNIGIDAAVDTPIMYAAGMTDAQGVLRPPTIGGARTPGGYIPLSANDVRGLNVGDRVAGTLVISRLNGVPVLYGTADAVQETVPLAQDTTIVGISNDANDTDNNMIFLSAQKDDHGNEIPSGVFTSPLRVYGGLCKPFSVGIAPGTPAKRDNLVITTTAPDYQDAYNGMRLVVTSLPQLQNLENPGIVIESTIVGYDRTTATLFINPPVDIGTAPATVMITPRRETRRIVRYASISGPLQDDITPGTTQLTLPADEMKVPFTGKASDVNGYYTGMLISVGTASYIKQVRTVVGYDAATRTITVNAPFTNTFYTDSGKDNIAKRLEGVGQPFPVSAGEFEVYGVPGPGFDLPSENDVGRLALSIIDGTTGVETVFSEGSYVSYVTPVPPGGNPTYIILDRNGELVDTSAASNVNSTLNLGGYGSSTFRINCGFVDKDFSAPLIMNYGRQDSRCAQQAYLSQTTQDQFSPLLYSGSIVGTNEMVCYRVVLLNLILPNAPIQGGRGGRIAFYPFVYVQLENQSAPESGNPVRIYSNNPNSKHMVFRVPINDINNPTTAPFIKLNADSQVQTMKFRPADNFRFKVLLPNGDVFQTVLPDSGPSNEPNPFAQVSAIFSITRLG